MKFNFGSAHDKLGEDWKNVDALDWNGNTDIFCDMREFPYPLVNDVADEIRCVECLEHISFRLVPLVLKEFYRILKSEGHIHIQVPDAGKAMMYYALNQVCDCVPHKAINNEFQANKKCPICNGKAKINPNRWLYTFTGAQKHNFDYHLSIFTRQILFELMCNAKFREIEIKEDIYKLKINAIK
jgi:predicted SAM-dependent methyltransferase